MWPALTAVRRTSVYRSSHGKRRLDDLEDDQLYEVDRILDKRIRDGLVEYLVKWTHWEARFNSWEREDAVGYRYIKRYETGLTDVLIELKKLHGPDSFMDSIQILESQLPFLLRRENMCNHSDASAMHVSQKTGFCTLDPDWTVRSFDPPGLLRHCVVVGPSIDGFVALTGRVLKEHDVVLIPSHEFVRESFHQQRMSAIPDAIARAWHEYVASAKTQAQRPPNVCIAFAVRFPTRTQLRNTQKPVGVSYDRLKALSIEASASTTGDASSSKYVCSRCDKRYNVRGWYLKHLKACTA